jgi:hypothetical protein
VQAALNMIDALINAKALSNEVTSLGTVLLKPSDIKTIQLSYREGILDKYTRFCVSFTLYKATLDAIDAMCF